MVSSQYGIQPARQALAARGYSLRGVADRFGLNYLHLIRVLYGRVRPSHELQVALTELTGLPVTTLFTSDALAEPYRIQRNSKVTNGRAGCAQLGMSAGSAAATTGGDA